MAKEFGVRFKEVKLSVRHGKVHVKHSYVVEDFNNENLLFSTNNLQGLFLLVSR